VPEIQEAIDREASTLASAKEELDLPIDDKRVNQVRAKEAIEKLKPVCEQVFKAVVDAAMNDSDIVSPPNFDAAVEEVFRIANPNGIRITRDLAIRMLEPLF
jgi:hypothetical protein